MAVIRTCPWHHAIVRHGLGREEFPDHCSPRYPKMRQKIYNNLQSKIGAELKSLNYSIIIQTKQKLISCKYQEQKAFSDISQDAPSFRSPQFLSEKTAHDYWLV